MYNEISLIIENYCNNYKKRAIKNRIVDIDQAKVISAYVAMWASRERNENKALSNLMICDFELYNELKDATSYGIEMKVYDDLVQLTEEFLSIHTEIVHETAENLGFGPRAKELRKERKSVRRKICKYIRRSIKNKIAYIKEWSKPRKKFILNASGEVHNGLYWTIRALIERPAFIKDGFAKVD